MKTNPNEQNIVLPKQDFQNQVWTELMRTIDPTKYLNNLNGYANEDNEKNKRKCENQKTNKQNILENSVWVSWRKGKKKKRMIHPRFWRKNQRF